MSKALANDCERNRLIRLLVALGHPPAELAAGFRLSPKQVGRIGQAGGGAAPPPRLTPAELRGVRRDFLLHAEAAANPEALAWLAAQRGAGRRSR